MKKWHLPLSRVYRQLKPGSVVLVTTAANIMAMSWHMMMETIHHHGMGSFMVAGETIKLQFRMKTFPERVATRQQLPEFPPGF